MPYVNIKITKEGNVTPEQKRQLIEGATKLLADVLHKNTKTLVVTIDEVDMDNWGIGGVSVTELRKIAKEYRDYEITLDRAMQTVISYIGLLSHCNGEGLKEWISRNISFTHGDSYGEWNGEYEQIAA